MTPDQPSGTFIDSFSNQYGAYSLYYDQATQQINVSYAGNNENFLLTEADRGRADGDLIRFVNSTVTFGDVISFYAQLSSPFARTETTGGSTSFQCDVVIDSVTIIDTVKAMALYRNHLNNPYKPVNNSPASPGSKRTLPSGEGREGLTTSTMDKNKKSSFQKLIAGLKNLVGTFDEDGPMAATKTLADDGGDIYFDGELAEGTAVFDDEAMTAPCADGDYQFDDGTQITVSGGLVTVVDSGTAETQNSAQLQTLKAKVAALEAEKLELENSLAESATVMAGATKALQVAKSTYKPATRENNFNHIAKRATETDDDIKAKMEERRAAYKKKK